eukprot:c35738_g1_i1 orf=342-806(+)
MMHPSPWQFCSWVVLVTFISISAMNRCCFSAPSFQYTDWLLQFKQEVDDPLGHLSTWKNGSDICQWTGVQCDKNETRVISISLPNMNLSGSIPSSIGRIRSLVGLDLSDNGFTGSIPTAFANLSRLRSLQLYANQLSGFLPPQLGLLTTLQIFR